jgi:oxygen-independent coproporphyrinogen-3 oxidase
MQDPRRIDPGLIRKYDVRGPRYTSYPPATQFHAVPAQDLLERWERRNGLDDDPGLSLYFHIPFCRARCLFCGCHSVVARDRENTDRYVGALVREMELAGRHVSLKRPVRQVALGGGTPNFLDEKQIDGLLQAMDGLWAVSEDAERSVEIDPRTATPGRLDAFLRHGFNRFSLGVQDLDPRVLRLVRRGQDLMQVEEVLAHLRRHGCQAINFDLIYGLPGQSVESVTATARQVVRLRPSRIALYSYAHVPWIHPRQKALERHGLPDPNVKLSLFLAMLDSFTEAGYLPIGMDHFALPDDPLAKALERRTMRRNFMGYTTARGTDLVGFGASAISSVGTSYSQNAKDLDAYLGGIADGKLPLERGFLLSADDEIRRELIMDLFCNFSVNLEALGRRFGFDSRAAFADERARLEELEKDGLVTLSPEGIAVTETGRFFIRTICMIFDRYLSKESGGMVYSRTV